MKITFPQKRFLKDLYYSYKSNDYLKIYLKIISIFIWVYIAFEPKKDEKNESKKVVSELGHFFWF